MKNIITKKVFLSDLKQIGFFVLIVTIFSMMGIILPDRGSANNPLNEVGITSHIAGHVFLGMIAGIATLSIRYIIYSGLFAVALDADHLINFLNMDIITRMGHSIPFAIIALFLMIIVFGKKKMIVGFLAFSAVFSHMSLDVFRNEGDFPLFVPFSTEVIVFSGNDWIMLLILASAVVAIGKIISLKIKIG
jgi:hypothetical protein